MSVPKIVIICLVAETWLMTNRWVILSEFLPFTPAEGLKIKVFLKLKSPGDIKISLQSTTKYDNKLFCCRVMAWDQHTCHFWTIFDLLLSLGGLTIEILRNKKISQRCYGFIQMYQKL